ncbi:MULTISPECIES: molybdopterin-dependent oxidoreductase [unclassified Nocardioides]|uniref:molybdopterin-dependent oxidoreductase n=1 Tax=unclassified Nocardioides TaxID=2615069 RepID=UPI0011510ED2|nr:MULTISPECIES: molybdopterin-dependent oxidoreductase [unclassified Nocardioides]TQK68396.1 DMSO/TMAO reductase YedYZ molybdopterin-dependent catalytic subunit [Nocardioides sp. SLBN-35]WGY02291.1 molybdopterin-dependent oxidoreductase [Nocardioides sp. QY071]
MTTRLQWASYGVLSTLVGIGLAHLAAALSDAATSPVLAVGSAVIDRTPTPMKEWAIRNFGSADKAILVGSVLAGVLVLAAVAGLLARRRFAVGAGLLVALVAVAGGAVLTRPEVEPLDLLPSVVAAVAAVAALRLLAGTHQQATAAEGSRRTVLLTVTALAALAAVGGVAGRLVSGLRARPEDVTLPTPTDPAPPLPRGLDDQVRGITPFRTPTGDFYRVDTRLDVPVISADDWSLTIDGDVDRKVTLSFDDLLAMPMVERDITLTCVSNSVGGPYVGAARWLGVRLTDVLDLAGIGSTKADQILSTDFAGMTISTPLALATDGRDALVAVGMNGRALPREHGFPVRLVIPGLYGFISATKWLRRLTLTTYDDRQAYWTERGWATDAPIKISARIDTPKALAELDAGDVVVGGVAWAQERGGIAGVQVRIDGGRWVDAQLGPDGGDDYWRQWFHRWPAEPGSHRIAVRAVAGNGEPQTAARAEPFPNGASGLHELLVRVS